VWTNLKVDEEVRLSVRNMTNDYLAVGDSMGRIRLYKFPCQIVRVGNALYREHTVVLVTVSATHHIQLF